MICSVSVAETSAPDFVLSFFFIPPGIDFGFLVMDGGVLFGHHRWGRTCCTSCIMGGCTHTMSYPYPLSGIMNQSVSFYPGYALRDVIYIHRAVLARASI